MSEVKESRGRVKAKHTATPWRYEIAEHECRILAGGRIIAYVHFGPFIAEVAEANAAFIVEACNSYDDLVAEGDAS